MGKSAPRCRAVVFTWNNYPENAEDLLGKMDMFSYIVGGYEVGENGTPHIQGYAELDKQTVITKINKVLKGCHVEKRKGTQKQAITYCVKDDKWFEIGVKKTQGLRTDILELQQSIERRETKRFRYENYSAQWRFRRAADEYENLVVRDNNRDFEKLNVIVLFGPADAGKSRKAREISGGEEFLYTVPGNEGKWFDGYSYEDYILLEDFEGEMPYRKLLKYLDGYKFNVPVKGGFTWKMWKNVIITTNIEPENWYPNEDYAPLKRRISEVQRIV